MATRTRTAKPASAAASPPTATRRAASSKPRAATAKAAPAGASPATLMRGDDPAATRAAVTGTLDPITATNGHRASAEAFPKPKDKRKGKTKTKGKGKAKAAGGGEATTVVLKGGKLDRRFYEDELRKLDIELNRLQEWIRHAGLKIVVLFEGRDAAGKGGTIKTISASLNPRICRVVALGTPSDRQKTQWYFQRYTEHLPAAGEMVLFDRSWYNRAGVERVMGFCSEEEYREFLRSAPEFERMLQRSGITVIKYWFSVSDEEQERRFQARIDDPTKRWKLSPMDLQSRTRWVDYSRAKDEMFAHTDTKTTPWHVVQADDKRRARLNTIKHLLSLIPYGDVPQQRIKLPPRQSDVGYTRPPVDTQTFIPDHYGG